MVLRRYAIANFKDITEGGVWPCAEKVGEVPLVAGVGPANNINRCRARGRIQVRINEGNQMLAKAEQIGRRNHRVARYLTFDDKITLMDERVLKTASEVIYRGRTGWR